MQMGLPVIKELGRFDSLSNLAKQQNLELKTFLLRSDLVESTKEISYMLQLPIASKVYELKRLRYINNRPMLLEHSHIPWNLVKGIELLYDRNMSFYQLLKEQYKLRMCSSDQEIIITNISDLQKELLQTDMETLPMLKSITKDSKGNVVEYCEDIFLPELYKFQDRMGE